MNPEQDNQVEKNQEPINLANKEKFFISPENSDNENFKKTPQYSPYSFVCEPHSLTIVSYCHKHVEYLCPECEKAHFSHTKELDYYDKELLELDIKHVENFLAQVKEDLIFNQKALKKIVENETNKSEDISLILKKIYHFLTTPLINVQKPLPAFGSGKEKVSFEEKPQSKVKDCIPLSNLILDFEDQHFIKLLLDQHLKKHDKLYLIYQGSRDGFKAYDFHRCCDGHPKTLLLAKSTYGNIFGGYTSVPWRSSNKGKFVEDPTAFLFSLTYHTKHKLKKGEEFSVFHSKLLGPTFGKGFDLCIKDDASKKAENYAKLGISFMGPSHEDEDEEIGNLSYLGGGEDFGIQEYEVFEIKNS